MRNRHASSCFTALLLTAVVLTGTGAAAEEASYTPGTYSDTQQGLGGDVVITITTDETSITDVQITGDNETPDIGGATIEALAPAMLVVLGSGEERMRYDLAWFPVG